MPAYYMRCNYVLKTLSLVELEVQSEHTTEGLLNSRACRTSWGRGWRSKVKWLNHWQQKT